MYNIEMRRDFQAFVEKPMGKDGLIVCGLNWGAKKGEDIPEETTWSSATFYDGCDSSEAEPKFDPFRGSVADLLRSFGYTLTRNSALDRAIIPTNLFYNKTYGCSKGTFVADNWKSAVKRLFTGAESLNPTGILITGMSARDFIWQYLSREDLTFNWSADTQDTPELKIGMFSNIPFMLTHHYNTHKPEVAPKNLLLDNTYKPIVKKWLGAVLPDFTPTDV